MCCILPIFIFTAHGIEGKCPLHRGAQCSRNIHILSCGGGGGHTLLFTFIFTLASINIFTQVHKTNILQSTRYFICFVLLMFQYFESVFFYVYLEAKGELATGWNMNCPLTSGPPSSQNWSKNSLLLAPKRSFLTAKCGQDKLQYSSHWCSSGAPSSRSSSSPPTSSSTS